jgi:hypothetical protein
MKIRESTVVLGNTTSEEEFVAAIAGPSRYTHRSTTLEDLERNIAAAINAGGNALEALDTFVAFGVINEALKQDYLRQHPEIRADADAADAIDGVENMGDALVTVTGDMVFNFCGDTAPAA